MEDVMDVAVVGAGDLVGEETMRLLAQQAVPIGKLHALDSGGIVGRPAECGETRLVIADAGEFDYSRVQLVLSSVDASTAAQCLPLAIAAGCVVVDSSGYFEGDGQTPTVVFDHNPQALERAARHLAERTGLAGASPPGQSVATPGYVATQTLRVLGAVHREFAVKRVSISVCHPAARGGRGGVESLARHSIAALGGGGAHAHGATQAFAVVPRPGQATGVGATQQTEGAEPELLRRLHALLGDRALDLRVAELLAPVFYDCTVVLDVDTDVELDSSQVRMLLENIPGVAFSTTPPVGRVGRHRVDGEPDTEAGEEPESEQDAAIRVLWLRSTAHGHGISLCFSADAVRCGVAGNQVAIAAQLMRDASLG